MLGRGWRFRFCSRLRRETTGIFDPINQFFFLTSSRRLRPDSDVSSRVPHAPSYPGYKSSLSNVCAAMFRGDGWWKVAASPNRSILRRHRWGYSARWSIGCTASIRGSSISRDRAGCDVVAMVSHSFGPKLCGERIPTIARHTWSVYNPGELYLH